MVRSTLADANEWRDWRIFADFAQVLIGIARPLNTNDPLGVVRDERAGPLLSHARHSGLPDWRPAV
jgi:hypothetical protein